MSGVGAPNGMAASFGRRWAALLGLSLVFGLALRLLFTEDMEYKEDEEYNFTQTTLGTWPWWGMPSGVYIANPGMSVWIFTWLARLSAAHDPVSLQRALSVFAWLGVSLLIPFALRLVREEERAPWFWAAALALVNPFYVFYQRKLWPEPFLPFFCVLWLAGWWRRERRAGAFAWGFVGAWLGQIHMSGFFTAFALALGTAIWDRRRPKWGAWFVGSALGALPLLPWAWRVVTHPVRETIGRGVGEMLQAKFWVFWSTNPWGLHLGNPLGLLRGPSTWAQISDFVRYPVLDGMPTYLNLVAHAVAAAAGVWIFASSLRSGLRSGRLRRPRASLDIALASLLLFAGLLLTLSGALIRRYYLLAVFPLEFVWFARLALRSLPPARARGALGALWASQLFMSACLVGYVHVHDGATQGDYGDAYHVVMKKRKPTP